MSARFGVALQNTTNLLPSGELFRDQCGPQVEDPGHDRRLDVLRCARMSDFLPDAAGDNYIDRPVVYQMPELLDKLVTRRAVKVERIGVDSKIDSPRVEQPSGRRK